VWERSSEGQLFVNPAHQRCRALLEAGRGNPAEAERWASEAIRRTEEIGTQWDWLEALRARAISSGLVHDPAAAASLRLVWEHCEREGVSDPGVFPVAPDLVEALVETGETGEAVAVVERLSVLAREQEHPWGLATATRCGVLVHFDQEASGEAARAYEALGLRFDQARTLLALGRGERSELSRVGARKPQAEGGLTKTEARVAALAAEGMSNKEIARALFVTVHTVEVHLSHAYAKLGIRSRSQLGPRLSSG